MARQSAEPKAPQAEVVTESTTNNTARVGAYVDTSLTKRNVSQTAPPLNVPPPSGATTLGSTRSTYTDDQKTEIENTEAQQENTNVVLPPHAPNSWRTRKVNGITYSRDPYAHRGCDDYMNNSGGS